MEETTWDDADDDDDDDDDAAAAVNPRKESAEILMMVVAARIRLLPRSPFGCWRDGGRCHSAARAASYSRINRHSPRGDKVDSSHESPVP